MRDLIANALLRVSSAFYSASVACKNAALTVLTFRRRRAGR